MDESLGENFIDRLAVITGAALATKCATSIGSAAVKLFSKPTEDFQELQLAHDRWKWATLTYVAMLVRERIARGEKLTECRKIIELFEYGGLPLPLDEPLPMPGPDDPEAEAFAEQFLAKKPKSLYETS